jgi:hypothetical protein
MSKLVKAVMFCLVMRRCPDIITAVTPTTLSIYSSIYRWLYSPFVGPWLLFQFLDLLQLVDFLNGKSAGRKAATCTQDSTNTE